MKPAVGTATRTNTPANPCMQGAAASNRRSAGGGQSTPPISDEAIHDARKALKKARAALRLLQDGMSKTTYQLENSRLRDSGRFLSPFRDAKSLIDAFDSLRDRYGDELRGFELAPLQKILHANLIKARRHFSHTPTEQENCVRLLKDCVALTKKEDFASINSEAINPGLRRIYRKGCKARTEADTVRTPEALHEWRKQVKYLLNAVEGLQPVAKGDVAKILKWTESLADSLGYDHDLAMLSQETARGTYAPVEAEVIKTLHGLIDRRRAKLQERAFSLGKKLYDKKPKQFAKNIQAHMSRSPALST